MGTNHELTATVLTSMLSSAIAPVTLISGIAFLTSIMANRYARCIDRVRSLIKEMNESPLLPKRREQLLMQLNILYSRTRKLRTTMTVAALSIFCVVLTICGSFSNMLTQLPSTESIAAIFLCALMLLVAAVAGFIQDILISLKAVKIEIKSAIELEIN